MSVMFGDDVIAASFGAAGSSPSIVVGKVVSVVNMLVSGVDQSSSTHC